MSQEFCTNCGAPLAGDAAFCTECGTPVPDPSVSQPTAADAPPASEPVEQKDDLSGSSEAFCRSCGTPLSANQSFCTRCGKPAASPATGDSPTREVAVTAPATAFKATTDTRELPGWVWIAASVLVLALGGLGVWALIGNDEDPSTAVPSTLVFEDPGSVSSAPSVSTDTATATTSIDCSDAAQRLTDEIMAWAAAVGSSGLGATAPVTDTGDCDFDSSVQAALPDIESALASSTGYSRAALLAFLLQPESPSAALTAAQASYPAHRLFTPRLHPTPSWVVVLESLESNQYSQSQAEARTIGYTGRFPAVAVVLSDDFISLRAGYWAIVGTGHSSFDTALASCQAAGLGANQCYPRLLQHASDPNALDGCGYFGRYTAESTAGVQLHPRSSSAELRGELTMGAEAYAVGPAMQANGAMWLPIAGAFADDNRMGWVNAGTVSLSPDCVSQPQVPSGDTCQSIANDAVAELAAEAPSGPRLDWVVARAEFAACDPGSTNALISNSMTDLTSNDPATQLRAILWSEIPFLESS